MRYLLVIPLTLALAACGDTAGPSDQIPDELAGTWQASPECLPQCGFTLFRVSDPADSVNFVSGLQQTFLLTMSSSGRFGLTGLAGTSTIQGRVRAEGSLLIMRDQMETQDTADYVLDGEYLELEFRGIAEQFDFDGDGVGDPSMVRARLQKQQPASLTGAAGQ